MRYFAVSIALLIFLSSVVSAASEDAMKANERMKSAELDMENMAALGLPVSRYNDTLTAAKLLYAAEYVLENSSGKPGDYSLAYRKINEMAELRQTEFRTADELEALKYAISEAKVSDKEAINAIYLEAKAEFESERYDESMALVSKAYDKISEMEAVDTKVKAVYEAASRGIFGFVKENKKEIISVLLIFCVAVAITYERFTIHLTKRKIADLERRGYTIKQLIGKTQKEYFEGEKMSEISYNIRIKKYGEMLREINREIPLLKESIINKKGR